jgi:alcohol dehydrogenase class IV
MTRARQFAAPPLSATQLAIWPAAATFFGAGEVARLPDCVEMVGKRRAFVVTDPGVVASGVAGVVAEVLAAVGIEHAVHDQLRPNPDTGALETGRRALREFGDAAVIGLGGGTALDAAKGISLAASNDLDVRELDYRRQPARPGQPVIAIPTTAGTGAETNGFGVIDDPEAHRKFYVGGASVMPRATILDPQLTVGLPPGPTAATGIDAFTHALESLSSRRANPFAHGLALEVVRMVVSWLPAAVADGGDLEARSQMLLAAHMAGLAFVTTGLGLCHAIGHALSARLGTAHGVALAVALPHVLAFNQPVSAEIQAEMAAAAGADTASEAAWRLSSGLGMPQTLAELGCTRELVPLLVQDALADEVLANTPRPPTPEELTALLESAL